MNYIDKVLEIFKKKIETYDRDGGFIVWEEDYANDDFDVFLIEDFIKQSLLTLQEQHKKELKELRDDVFNIDFYCDKEREKIRDKFNKHINSK